MKRLALVALSAAFAIGTAFAAGNTDLDIDKVNGSIHVPDNATIGKLSTVNGSIHVGDGAHAAFSRIVIQLKDAVVEIGTQAFHSGQGVSDGGGQWRFARDCGELHCQPSFQIVEDWGGVGFAEFRAAVWR